MEIPVQQFYGSPGGRAKKMPLQQRVEERLRQYQTHPLLEAHRLSLVDDQHVWRAFGRQRDALDYLEAALHKEHLKIFAFESVHSAGGRRYLVTSGQHFWSIYSKLPAALRNCYELIRNGHPCRLYFDLEFSRQMNPDMLDEPCVQRFVEYVRYALLSLLNIDCDEGCVLDLSASTVQKFSRHLVVHLPNNVAFSNNLSVGSFVKEMCLMLRNMGEEERRRRGLECLFVLKNDGSRALLCDEGVYTRNRTFRLFLSSKLKQNNPLVLASTCHFYQKKGVQPSEQNIFFDSLIETSGQDLVSYGNDASSAKPSWHGVVALPTDDVIEGVEEPLPFPALQNFFRDYLSRQKDKAAVRRWVYAKEAEKLVLDICNYRYCHRIGREHKSNHIMYVVDLRRSVFYQKCHDPECAAVNYRSNDFPLPREVTAAPPVQEKCQFDDSVSDELFLRIASLLDEADG